MEKLLTLDRWRDFRENDTRFDDISQRMGAYSLITRLCFHFKETEDPT